MEIVLIVLIVIFIISFVVELGGDNGVFNLIGGSIDISVKEVFDLFLYYLVVTRYSTMKVENGIITKTVPLTDKTFGRVFKEDDGKVVFNSYMDFTDEDFFTKSFLNKLTQNNKTTHDLAMNYLDDYMGNMFFRFFRDRESNLTTVLKNLKKFIKKKKYKIIDNDFTLQDTPHRQKIILTHMFEEQERKKKEEEEQKKKEEEERKRKEEEERKKKEEEETSLSSHSIKYYHFVKFNV